MDSLENLKNEIKIPKSIDLAIKRGIEKGRKEKNAKKLQTTYKKAAAAAAILVVTASVAIIRPDIVKAIPGVQSIFKLINHGNMGENFDKFEQFSTTVNKTIEKNGLKITIEEITVDDNVLAITSVVEGKNLQEDRGYMGNIKINDKLVYTSSSKDKKVDDNTLMMVAYAKVSDMNLPKDLNIDFNIVWLNDVKGPWDFKFTVVKSDTPVNSRVVNIDKSIKLPGRTLNLGKLIISPLGNTIEYSGDYDVPRNLLGYDELDFIVMDDKGKILECHSSVGTVNSEKYKGNTEINGDLSNAKALTLVPLFNKWGPRTMPINNTPYFILQTTINSTNFNLPQETIIKSRPVTEKEKASGCDGDNITQVFNIDKAREFSTIDKLVNQLIMVGDNNSVIIKSIDATENETTITFKVQGNGSYYYRNFNYAAILDENYNFILREGDGDISSTANKEEGTISVKLPPIDKTKKYKIALPVIDEPEIEEQYKINIDLTK